MHIKRMHEMIEKLTECTKSAMDGEKLTVGKYPIGDVVDMIKDLNEAEYYAKICKAMDEAEEEEKHDRMFYPRRRDSRGRFVGNRGRYGYDEPPYMHMPLEGMDMGEYRSMHGMSGTNYGRDMDLKKGRMYYDDKQREWDDMDEVMPSRYGFSHDEYLEKRKMYANQTPEDKKKRRELLDGYLEDLGDMSKEIVDGMTMEEKQLWKTKLTQILNM